MQPKINSAPITISELLPDDGTFPNNQELPLIVYQQALELPDEDAAPLVDNIFKKNNWKNSWKNGIFTYHHYHSTAHEVLGIYRGHAKVEFGGPNGILILVQKGDIVIIPAGVVHKNLGGSSDFGCVGAYPDGQIFDMNYGKPGERPRSDENIRGVNLPNTDPIYGKEGAVVNEWLT